MLNSDIRSSQGRLQAGAEVLRAPPVSTFSITVTL